MILLSLLAAAAVAAESVPMASEQGLASIDFAGRGGIRDWHADNDRGIFLRDSANRWYYAAFRHSCPGVLSDRTIAFDTNGFDRFDRSSLVVTDTEVCAVKSVDRGPAPAAKGGISASR